MFEISLAINFVVLFLSAKIMGDYLHLYSLGLEGVAITIILLIIAFLLTLILILHQRRIANKQRS